MAPGSSVLSQVAFRHIAFKGLLHCGKTAEVRGSTGSSFASTSRLVVGVVAWGARLHAAQPQGVDWFEAPAPLSTEDPGGGRADFLECATRQGRARSRPPPPPAPGP
jgi:hypothetical protein